MQQVASVHTLNIPSSRLRSDPIARKWSNTMLTTQRRRLRAGPLRVGQSPFHRILIATAELYRAAAYTDCYKLQRPHTAPKIVTVGLPVGPSAHETLPTRKRLFSPLYVSESVSRCLFVVEAAHPRYSGYIAHIYAMSQTDANLRVIVRNQSVIYVYAQAALLLTRRPWC